MSGHHRWADLRDNRRFRETADIDRHLGMWCGCPLVECCHNEDTDDGDRWRVTPGDLLGCGYGVHAHSGSPVSGYIQPREPGDKSWRDDAGLPRHIRPAPAPCPPGARNSQARDSPPLD